jgi:large subunit ribosomal protein L29
MGRMPGVRAVKADELRTLDAEELGSRLKGARRELYELRFKLAVGQLDDHRQVRKVRKDIARILTVVHARRLGEEVQAVEPEAEEAVAAATAVEETAEAADEETPEDVEAAPEAEAAAEPEPEAEAPPAERRRTRRGTPTGEKSE